MDDRATPPPCEPAHLLARFERAHPDLLEARTLLRRVDTKFVLSAHAISPLFEALLESYALVEAAGAPTDRYETLYFDTPSGYFFSEHLRGRRPRYKVRIRRYLRRSRAFLEVKQKNPADRTLKWRLQVPQKTASLRGEPARFVTHHCPVVPPKRLQPVLWSRFERVQLVGMHTVERVTIDWELGFEAEQSGSMRSLGPLVVAEVKQDRQRWRTPVMLALRGHRIRPLSVSKYCTGATLLGLGARTHRYRPRLRAMRRVSEEG